MQKNKVLIVDDDEKLQKLLTEYLEGYGFQVKAIPDGSTVLENIKSYSPGIVILDIMLPGQNGLEVLKDIRKEFSVPVIMLTAKGDDSDRIVGLELGADDYLAKPFNPRELLARIKAVMRRMYKIEDKNTIIEAGGLVLNRARHTLLMGDDEAELCLTEYKILKALMMNPNMVMSRDELMNYTQGRDFMAFERSIDVHISKIRARLKPYPDFRNLIKTVWGTGYIFKENK